MIVGTSLKEPASYFLVVLLKSAAVSPSNVGVGAQKSSRIWGGGWFWAVLSTISIGGSLLILYAKSALITIQFSWLRIALT